MMSEKKIHLGAALMMALLLGLSAWMLRGQARADTASQSPGSIVGTIVDTSGGLPIEGAQIELDQAAVKVAATVTAKDGSFGFSSVTAGTYSVLIAASGYEQSRVSQVVVLTGHTTEVRTAIRRTYSNVRQIGTVQVTSGGRGLQTSATINQTIPQARLQAENFVRAADAVGILPGITASTSNAVGDDIFLNIRGYNASETATLLDGHQIGPLGSAVNAFNTYDSQVSPFFGLRGVQVTYGSGATGLYGVDTIAGTVDYQTLAPTVRNSAMIEQGIGNEGKLLTGLQATGTVDKIGYALVHAVQGTYGNFAPAQIFQRGLSGNDLTSATAALNTYAVSGNYILRNDLAKMVYSFDSSTRLQLTTFSATAWEDKTGNGDQDNSPYQFQLFNAQQALAQNGNQTQVTLPNGTTATCTGSIAVLVDAPPNFQCLPVTQFAQQTSGPAGGGGGPWQAIKSQDYDARFSKDFHNNTLIVDGYVDNYTTDFNRELASGFFRSHFFVTHGLLVTDEITWPKNDFAFGYSLEHQEITNDQSNSTTNAIVFKQPFDIQDLGYFVNDQIYPNSRLSFYINLWLKHANVTPITSFDPRVSVMYRPTGADVLRITTGHSASVPQPALVFATPDVNGNVGSFFPNCGGNLQSTIGDVPDRNLGPEKANDYEFAYGHRFNGDNQVQLNLYSSNEYGALFEGTLPFAALGSTIPQSIIQLYLNKIASLCPNIPNPTAAANLNANTTFNAASATYRGIELSGTEHITRNFFADYIYDTQSAFFKGVPDPILMQNVTIINNAQMGGIPLHKYSVGLEYAGAIDVRLDNNYMDINNAVNHQPFWWTNASASRTSGPATFTLGVNNVFNSAAASPYGLFGLGTFQPENQFGTDTSALQQGVELYGMPARQVMFTVQYHI